MVGDTLCMNWNVFHWNDIPVKNSRTQCILCSFSQLVIYLS